MNVHARIIELDFIDLCMEEIMEVKKKAYQKCEGIPKRWAAMRSPQPDGLWKRGYY